MSYCSHIFSDPSRDIFLSKYFFHNTILPMNQYCICADLDLSLSTVIHLIFHSAIILKKIVPIILSYNLYMYLF